MSQLGLGCARLGSIAAGAGRRSSIRLIHEAVDHGISWFDTADAYTGGTSETLLGIALRDRRDRVRIATKGGFVFTDHGALGRAARTLAAPFLSRLRQRGAGRPSALSSSNGGTRYEVQEFSPAHLTTALEGSLRRLRTDHVEMYQLHGFGRSHHDTQPSVVEAIDEWAQKAVGSGKIGRLGIAAETLEQAALAPCFQHVTAVQLPFGMLDPEAGADLIPAASRDGLHVTVRGVLGAGLLAGPPAHAEPKAARIAGVQRIADELGVTAVQLALWFVAARPDVDIALVGTASTDHLRDVTTGFARPVPSSVRTAFDGLADEERTA